jgi:hypothetical protein
MQFDVTPSSFETNAARDAALRVLCLSCTEAAAVDELAFRCANPQYEVPPQCRELLKKQELLAEDGSVPRAVRFVVSESKRLA